jgi:hypothetical protein
VAAGAAPAHQPGETGQVALGARLGAADRELLDGGRDRVQAEHARPALAGACAASQGDPRQLGDRAVSVESSATTPAPSEAP